MTQETHDTLVWLLNLSRTLLSTRELDRLLELVAQVFLDATDAERVFVLLKEDDKLRVARGVAKSGQIVQLAEPRISSLANEVASGATAPVFTTDTVTDKRMARASVVDLGLQMVVCVPLRGPSGIVGVIYADGRTSSDHVFTNTNKSRLEALGDHAGAAIENARYFEGVTRDPDTQLVNAAYFKSMVEKNALQGVGWLVVAEVQEYDALVERLGARAGGQLLRVIADSARAHLIRPEFAGRLDKSELGLCLKGTDRDTVLHRVEAWAKQNHLVHLDETLPPVPVKLSVGMARLEEASPPATIVLADALIERARRERLIL